ncbi:MAG: alpha/beta fold hydrolase [Polyangiaceae bacterium]
MKLGLIGNGDPASRNFDGVGPGVLALHGFGGTPLEVDLVCDAARELGLAVRAPLLAGHGQSAKLLAATRYRDWLDSARDALTALLADHDQVILVGLSMGSLLATELALAQPERVTGLGLLANAFWLAEPLPSRVLALYRRVALPDFLVPKAAPDIREPAARRSHLTLGAQPVRAASEVYANGQRLRARLGELRCPVYLAHGALDRVCPAANLERVATRLGGPSLRTRLQPRAGHIVTRDYGAEDVRADLTCFFSDLRASHTPAEPDLRASHTPVEP